MDQIAQAEQSESLYGSEGWGFESLRARSNGGIACHLPGGHGQNPMGMARCMVKIKEVLAQMTDEDSVRPCGPERWG